MGVKGVEQRVKIDHPTFKQYPDRGPGIAVSPAQKLPWEQINPIQAPNRMSTADKTAGTAGATETTPMPQGGSYPYPPSTQLPEAGEKVGDKTAPMPKLQVQGDPHNVYAVQDGFDIPPKVEGQPQPSPLGSSISHPGQTRTVIDDKWVDQSTNLDRIRAMLANKDIQRALSLAGTGANLVPVYVDKPKDKKKPIEPELRRDLEIFGQLLANSGFTWHDFLVKHPASVEHYHGRKGRAYSTRTGMRVPEERHVLAEAEKK